MTHNNHTNPKPAKPEPAAPFHVTEMQIGNTTYIVRSFHSPNAREGLLDKLWRLIQNDAD